MAIAEPNRLLPSGLLSQVIGSDYKGKSQEKHFAYDRIFSDFPARVK
jgi:hypothetical protein